MHPDLALSLAPSFQGWDVSAVTDVLGEEALAALEREDLAPALVAAAAAGEDRVVTLTRLWMLGERLPRRLVEAAHPGVQVDHLVQSGVLRVSGDDAVAAIDVRPTSAEDGAGVHTWWVASDLGENVTGQALPPDHVVGMGGASSTLANLTMRRPVERVADMGTGCGIQALHATRHARDVVATDISERALEFAAFNAALNGVEMDLRRGSMLEPLADAEGFDLLVSNPPFVIAPPGSPRYVYRSGEEAGDGIVEHLVRHVGEVLRPGGHAQFLGNWEIPRGAAWSERLERWCDEADVPVDVWVVQRDVLEPAQYASLWLRDAGLTLDRDRSGALAATRAYLEDFERRGVEAVGMGVVMMRRSQSAQPLRRFEEQAGPLPGGMGEVIAAAWDAQDWLVQTDDATLLGTALTVAGDVTDERYFRPGSPDPEHILLRQGGGFGRAIVADTVAAAVAGACDGELTVGQIAAALAALLDVDGDAMRNQVVAQVRHLVRDGMLLV